MPTKGRPKKSKRVPGAYEYSCEIRDGMVSVPVIFHVKGVPRSKIPKGHRWLVKHIIDERKLELVLTPAPKSAPIDICKLTASRVEGSEIVRVGYEGPKDINPRGHVQNNLQDQRRVRLALVESQRLNA